MIGLQKQDYINIIKIFNIHRELKKSNDSNR